MSEFEQLEKSLSQISVYGLIAIISVGLSIAILLIAVLAWKEYKRRRDKRDE